VRSEQWLDQPVGTSDYLLDLQERGFGDVDATVCLDCIHDGALRGELATRLTEPACSFCERESDDGETPIAADMEALMRVVIDAIRFLYDRSIDVLYFADDVTPRLTSGDVVEDVCAGAVTDQVLEVLLAAIDGEEWNEDPGALSPDVALGYAWDHFKEKVKHETRFVFLAIPEEHSDHPDEFTTAETLQKIAEIVQSRGILKTVETGRRFWRGRMIDDRSTDGYNAAKLGSPPLDKAAANRMSPAGISMFYGSDDVATVVAEIGAHSAKSFAVVGEFEGSPWFRVSGDVVLAGHAASRAVA